MKKILSVTLLLFAGLTICGQAVYSDAVKLRSMMVKDGNLFFFDPTKNETIYSILKNYTLDTTGKKEAASDKGIDRNICGTDRPNPFICKFFPAAVAGPSKAISSILSSIGSLDVTAFADGLAKFLVERTKEELNEAFFRKFADFLNHYPEFRTLFPYTNTFVNSFNSWEYSSLLNTLREAFDKDIKEFLDNFIELRNLDSSSCKDSENAKNCKENWCGDCQKRMSSVNAFFKTTEGLYILTATKIGSGILNNEKVPDIINSVINKDFLLATNHSVLQSSLQLANIFSLSLKAEETGRHYIGEEQFKNLIDDPVLQDLFWGLIFQQIKNANNGKGIKIGNADIVSLLTPGNIQGFKNYISDVYTHCKNVQYAFKKLSDDRLDGKVELGQDYAIIFESIKQLFNTLQNLGIINDMILTPVELANFIEYVSKGLQIAHDIAVRNYNAAVIGTLKLLADASKEHLNDYPQFQQFISAFLKYGSFASNVVLSKDPDDVKEAIKSFVLPSGSSSLKKHNMFTISLNSYVGFVYGKTKDEEFTTKAINGTDSIVKLNGGNSIGMYAPVGVGFNWGLGWRKKNPWSVSIYASLIDIGAVVGYRFVTDSGDVSQKFKINLSNILAPGGNVIIGLPNMPIAIGGGFQWIPSLQRDPKSNEFYNIDHSGFRGQVFVTVDLPLLNFHSSKHSLMYVKTKL